MLVKLI